MALAKGKYDDALSLARLRYDLGSAVLIVIEGPHGQGFSVQATPEILAKLPELLRTTAALIEREVKIDLAMYEGFGQ